MGYAQRRHFGRRRPRRVRAEGRRSTARVVADRHQRRRLEIFSRTARHAAARDQRAPAHLARGRYDRRMGRQAGILRRRRRARNFPRRAHLPAPQSEGLVQQPRVFQRRHRGQAAVLRLLHPQGRRQHGLDPELVPQRGHDLQRRLRRRRQPVGAALMPRETFVGRHRVGTVVVHEGGRRERRRDQVGRQDAARGQDGRAQCRPSRHRRFHQVQSRRRAQGVGADRGGLRLLARRPRIRLGVLPERQQLRARHRRLHAGGARRRRMADALRQVERGGRDPSRAQGARR